MRGKRPTASTRSRRLAHGATTIGWRRRQQRAEFLAGTHPRGRFARPPREGASNTFFSWQLALANPEAVDAHVLVSALLSDGTVRASRGPSRRAPASAGGRDLGIGAAEFGVEIEADVAVVPIG